MLQLLFALGVVGLGLPIAATLPPVPGIKLIGKGYNILKANPDVVSLQMSTHDDGMQDPGLTGKRIFALTYDNNRTDLYEK